MDEFASTIVAAIPYIADKVGGHVLKDGYDKIKGWLINKLGGGNKVSQAITEVEANPKSEERKLILHKEIINAKLDQEPELITLVNQLRAELQRMGQQQSPQQNTYVSVGNANHSQVAGVVNNNYR